MIVWLSVTVVNGVDGLKYDEMRSRNENRMRAFRERYTDETFEEKLRFEYPSALSFGLPDGIRNLILDFVCEENEEMKRKWEIYADAHRFDTELAFLILMAQRRKLTEASTGICFYTVMWHKTQPSDRMLCAGMNECMLLKIRDTIGHDAALLFRTGGSPRWERLEWSMTSPDFPVTSPAAHFRFVPWDFSEEF